MPGLIGFVGNKDQDSLKKLMSDMAQAMMEHPDYRQEMYTEAGLGLGRVTLGLLNPETQPLWNQNKTLCIAMEGEIFDYAALKQDLLAKGYQFQGDSEVELILGLYKEYGPDFAIKLNGAFIIAIWDSVAKKLLLVTDRLGLYRIFYIRHQGNLLFASGVRALLADPAVPRDVDHTTMLQFLTIDHVLGNRTLIKQICLMPPASILTFQRGEFDIQPYWRLQFAHEYPARTIDSYLEELDHLINQAFARYIKHDLPAGILLSGGLDSRVVLGMLRRHAPDMPLHTFTFGVPNCDDARYAREAAVVKKTAHHFYELEPDYLLAAVDKGIQLTDGLSNVVHFHALATLSQETQHAKAFYKGFFGDSLMGFGIGQILWGNYNDEEFTKLFLQEYYTVFDWDEHQHLFTPEFLAASGKIEDALHQVLKLSAEASQLFDRFKILDFRNRQRRMTLNGLELVRSQGIVRAPFCENDLVEFMLKVPPGLRVDRYLMKQYFAGSFNDLAKIPSTETGYPYVPCLRDSLLRLNNQMRWRLRGAGLHWVSMPKKRSYHNYDHWLRSTLRHWVEDILLDARTLSRGYFNPDYVRKVVQEHFDGATFNKKLGGLIALELWHRRYID